MTGGKVTAKGKYNLVDTETGEEHKSQTNRYSKINSIWNAFLFASCLPFFPHCGPRFSWE